MCGASFLLVVVNSNITDGNGLTAGFMAFTSPLIGLIIALSSRTDEAKAVVHGESSAYKKCPFCAEAIRKEAIKCKHCGSDLTKISSTVDAAKKAVNTEDLLIKKRDGFMINDDGVKKLVESFFIQSPDSTNVYQDFEDEISTIKCTLPSEVHESFIRKIKYWNNVLLTRCTNIYYVLCSISDTAMLEITSNMFKSFLEPHHMTSSLFD